MKSADNKLTAWRRSAYARDHSSLDAKRKPWTQVGRKRFYFASKNKWIGCNDLTAGNTALDGLDAKFRTWSERDRANSQSTDFTDYADEPLGDSPAFPNLRPSAKSADRKPAFLCAFAPGREIQIHRKKKSNLGPLCARVTTLVVVTNSISTDFTDYADELLADWSAFSICVNRRNLRT
ncbi:MAG: hypothetical protein AB7O68_00005, partial [Pirellulales bacterium]